MERRLPSILLDRRVQFLLAFVAAVLFAVVAWKLRMLPYYNYEQVYDLAVKVGIRSDVAKYAYINANDPWIEYWLAKYLAEHGLGSWTTLTRSNPATHIFWYPWGRDFTKTEYPLVPMMAALTGDPLWGIDVVPVLAGVALVFAVFLFEADLYGPLAAVLGSMLVAVLPAAASRTFAGFTEKTGIAMPFLIIALWLYVRTLRAGEEKRWLPLAVATAVAWLLVELTWGGYALMHATVALTVLLAPFFAGLEGARRVVEKSFAAFLVFSVLAYGFQAAGYGKVSNTFTLATLAVLVIVYVLVEYLQGRLAGIRLPERYVHQPLRLYAIIVGALFVLGVAAGYATGALHNKYGYTILWPLRDLGLVHMGRVEETVAEMSSALRPGNFRGFLREANVLAFLAPLAAIYMLYRAYKERRIDHVPHTALALVLFYGVLGMLYLLESFSVINTLVVAAAAELLLASALRVTVAVTRRRRVQAHRTVPREFKLLALGFYVLLIILGSLYSASVTAQSLGATTATITGSSKSQVYLSWLWLLQHLKYDVPRSDVVVSWWDYGYWISVGSGHPTLADGATLNGTQLRLLARMLTGSESEAVKIMHMLRLEPGKTYVLINDIALYDTRNKAFIYLFPRNGIDLMKSWAMHHIAGRDEKFQEIVTLLSQMAAQRTAAAAYLPRLEKLLNDTLVFKLAIDGAFEFQRHGVVVPQRYANLFGNREVRSVTLYTVSLNKELKMTRFKPYLVVVSPFMTIDGKVKTLQGGLIPVHIIVVYEWTK